MSADELSRNRFQHRLVEFINRECGPSETLLVPEINLLLARESHQIFQNTRAFQERHPDVEAWPPYWAFAWPGGQAMARHILDNPNMVRDLRIADIGSGSGIAAIAAAKCEAAHVLAVDVDPIAATTIALNARLNEVSDRIDISDRDCLAELPDVDLILISDLVYEPELAVRVGGFIERALGAGIAVAMGDRMSSRRPARGFTEVARYDAPLTPALCEEDAEQGRIWHCAPDRRRTRSTARAKVDE